jgi:signal transduction histidine kinase
MSDGALPQDDADPLARLLDALASASDLVGLCAALQAYVPSLVQHHWALLLIIAPERQLCSWYIDSPTPILQACLPSEITAFGALTQFAHGPSLNAAPAPIQAAFRPFTDLNGRYVVLPLQIPEGAAVLGLVSTEDAPLSQAEQQVLRTASSGIRLALQHVLLTAKVQRIEDNAQLLDSIRTTIAQTLELDALLRQVVEQVALRYGYSLVSLFLLEGDTLYCKHQIGYTNILQRVPVTTGIMARAVRQRQTICVTDVRTNPEFIAVMPGIMSEIAVPLHSEHTMYGVLNVESLRDQRLGRSDQTLLEAVGVEASVAIERALLYTAMHRQAQQLALIDQLRVVIASQLDIDALGDTIVRLLRDQLRFEFVSLFLLQDDMLCLRAWCGHYPRLMPRLTRNQGLNGLCVRKRQPLLVKNVRAQPEYVSLAETVVSGIYVPLMYDQTVLGTLCIESRTVLTKSDFDIVASLGQQIAAALEQSRRIEAAHRARERDAFLNKLLSAINQAQPDEWRDVWDRLAVQLGVLLEADLCAIGLFEADGSMRLNIWNAQSNGMDLSAFEHVPASAFTSTVLNDFRHGKSLYTSDLAEKLGEHSMLRTMIIAAGVVALAVVPVIVDQELVALLGVSHQKLWRWQRDEIALLEGMAQHLAIALRQANLRMQEAQRRHELELVYQTALDINAHHDLEPVLHAIVDRACSLLAADCATLYLVLPNEEEVELRVGINIPVHLIGSRTGRHEGLVGKTLGGTHSYLVPDYATWTQHDPNFEFTRLRAALGVPLIAASRPIGALLVAHTGVDKQFSATDQRLIELLAALAAQAIETAQLLENVRRRNTEMEAVYATALSLSMHHNLQEVLQNIVERAHSLIGSVNAGLNLLDPITQELELRVGVNIPEDMMHSRVKVGEGIVGQVAQTGQSIRIDNYQTWSSPAKLYVDLPWHSVLVVPLLSGERVLGTIGLAHTDPNKRFTVHDQQLMELFASQGAQAVEYAQRLEREQMLRADAEQSLAEMQAVLQELEQTNERLGRLDQMRLLGELASEVAHDFNNALGSVLGNSQWLLLDETNPERIETLRAIEAAARDSATMIKRLQEFSRSHQGPYIEMVDINTIVRDAVTMTQTRWRELTGAHIVLQAKQSVRGSASDLRRVLMNLIVNAIDAMPDGGTLEIMTGDTHDSVQITVRDSGVGILPDVQGRVFDPFFTTKAVGMGTGLGLSICHQIIARHGGTIAVESERGVGTTFTIHLPVAADDALTMVASNL